jgi:intraflagellar transport protein 74
MDEFLNTWEANSTSERERLSQLESQILLTLHKLSKQQSLMQLVPSITDYSSAKEDLSIKEGELEKSKATLEGIAVEYQRLQNNLQKMEDLEGKINDEMNAIKEQLATIQISAVKFTGLEDLRRETEEKRNQLMLELEDLAERKNFLQDRSRRLQAEFDKLQVHLLVKIYTVYFKKIILFFS